MNLIFFSITLIAFLTAGWRQACWMRHEIGMSPMESLSKGMVESATGSVELALGLVGVMTLFLGLMKVAEAGGMLTIIARLIRPLMARLFPDVPPEHPAMGAMILNFSANALGLGNAATPFGIRAMQELDKLNSRHRTATDSMSLFLAINTSSVTLLPTGVIALRAAAGSADPAGILPTTLFATLCSTIVAICAAKICRRFFSQKGLEKGLEAPIPAAQVTKDETSLPEISSDTYAYPAWISWLALCSVVGAIPLAVYCGRAISPWIIPGLMAGVLGFGVIRHVRGYGFLVGRAKEGFQVAIKIIPYLVAILVVVGMLRSSGAMGAMVAWMGGLTGQVGMPPDALPMALLRPLSGSGAYGILASVINDPAIGPDSYTGYLVSTLQGSTETTFYVLAIYFGAVQVRRIRYTLAAALTADFAGIIAAVVICLYLFG